MDVFKAIKERRSARCFLLKEIEKILLDKIIEAGAWAPSASNKQAWKFIVVDNSEVKKQIVDFGGSILIKDAPAGILVLYDNRSINLEYLDFIQSAAAAIQNILLAAYSLGIGSCWVCRLPSKKRMRKIFKIPHYFDPIAYICLGYAAEDSRLIERKYKFEDLVAYNRFSFNYHISGNFLTFFINRLKRKLYFLSKEIICLWKK